MAGSDLTQYRPNVGVALFNRRGLVFIAKRIGDRHEFPWQMPQGGIDPGESPEVAALRELTEETGVQPDRITPLGSIERWLVYDFPPEVRAAKRWHWVGQKQRWFAFRFVGTDADIDLTVDERPEFDAWRWEELSAVPSLIIQWKRPVYEQVAVEFESFATLG